MNAVFHQTADALPIIGTQMIGGFYVGVINVGDDAYGLIVSPKAVGESTGAWNGANKAVLGAESYCDGLENTIAMGEAGSTLAQWARTLVIEGYTDWYLPSRDELEIMFRNLKPTTQENYASFRDGDNPSSSPVGYPYTEARPSQTTSSAFQLDGAEALEPVWHWSSTQYATDPSGAWSQNFSSGNQSSYHKSYEGRARAVRRFKI